MCQLFTGRSQHNFFILFFSIIKKKKKVFIFTWLIMHFFRKARSCISLYYVRALLYLPSFLPLQYFKHTWAGTFAFEAGAQHRIHVQTQ